MLIWPYTITTHMSMRRYAPNVLVLHSLLSCHMSINSLQYLTDCKIHLPKSMRNDVLKNLLIDSTCEQEKYWQAGIIGCIFWMIWQHTPGTVVSHPHHQAQNQGETWSWTLSNLKEGTEWFRVLATTLRIMTNMISSLSDRHWKDHATCPLFFPPPPPR